MRYRSNLLPHRTRREHRAPLSAGLARRWAARSADM